MDAAAFETALSNQPGFGLLPPDIRKLVMDSFVVVTYPFGATLAREGENLDALYIIAAGRARLVKRLESGDEVALEVLKPGDSFGAPSLLDDLPPPYSVRASTEVQALRLEKVLFKALVQSNPALKQYVDLQIRLKTLTSFFKLHTAFAQLPVEALQLLLDALEPVTVAKGTLVVRQGDPPGPMFIVEDGKLKTFVERNGQRQVLAYLRTGDFFGESSLLQGTARQANVEAVAQTRLLRLTPATFQRLITDYPAFRQQLEARAGQYHYKVLARVPLDFAQESIPPRPEGMTELDPEPSHTASLHAPVPTVKRHQSQPSPDSNPFASSEGYFKGRPRIKRFPLVRQIDEMDCGAACLAMVCRFFGRSVSMPRIRQLAHTGADGTTLKALCRAAETLGLAARPVKVRLEQVEQMPLPAVLHWGGNHWVVLYHLDDNHVWLADPGFGLRRKPRAELEQLWSGYAALFDYTPAFDAVPEGRPSLSWLWGYVTPHLPTLAKTGLLAVMVSLLEMSLPVCTQLIVDKVLVDRDVGLLQLLMGAMVAILILSILATGVQRYLLSFVAVRLDGATLDFVTRQLLALPLSYFNARRTGDIQRRLSGLRQVREFVVQDGVHVLTSGAELLGALTLMGIYSPTLLGVFLATSPLYVLLMRFSARYLQPMVKELEEAYGRYSSYQIDAIKGVETVKAMGVEGALRNLMLGEFHRIARRQFASDLTVMGYEGAIRGVTFLSTVLFLWVGASQVMGGTLTIGALVAFNTLVTMANGPIVSLLASWDNLQIVRVLVDRLNDVFEQEPEQGENHAHLKPVRSLEGRIQFRGVSFQYGGPQSPKILEDLNFDIPAGKRVAIVGRSGSGKSTLVKCLSGLLEPSEGTILFDGMDMKTLHYRQLRRHIGYVLQDNYLFNDTIARNIAFGEDEPDMDQVIAAAKAANAHEFIERLPLGYETKIGESGMSLSGGQKQRIAIARALFNAPPVLIFDEATSALDTESERAVKENIDQILAGRTSFIIAHRLSTIRDADLILVLEKGRLAEAGTHDALMDRQGLYYYLCSQQLGLD